MLLCEDLTKNYPNHNDNSGPAEIGTIIFLFNIILLAYYIAGIN